MGVLNNGDRNVIQEVVNDCLEAERKRWAPRRVDWAVIISLVGYGVTAAYWVGGLDRQQAINTVRIEKMGDQAVTQSEADQKLALRDQRIEALAETVRGVVQSVKSAEAAQSRATDAMLTLNIQLSRMTAELEAERRDRGEMRTWLRGLADRVSSLEKQSPAR